MHLDKFKIKIRLWTTYNYQILRTHRLWRFWGWDSLWLQVNWV